MQSGYMGGQHDWRSRRRDLTVCLVLAAAALSGCGPAAASTVPTTPPGAALSRPITTPSPAAGSSAPASTGATVTYCTVGGVALTMNVWLPQAGTAPHPVAVMVHGGGWRLIKTDDGPIIVIAPTITFGLPRGPD